MSRRLTLLFLLVTSAVMLPLRSPAPLIYTPGEGWYYELFGNNTKWQRPRAKDQVEVAEQALADKDYSTAMHAANRVLRVFPLSDYAPRAEYVLGRCFEAKGKDEAAFDAYQNIIQKYPKSSQYNEVMTRQFEIANRFLAGEWFRLWNTIPLYPSMDETAKLYAKIVSNGPYSAVAPHAQLNIGAAQEKAKSYGDAVKAYQTAADRYQDQPEIAADAMYRTGVAWQKQADTAEYDQGAAAEAIAAYTDFMAFYPDDPRVAAAQKAIVGLKAEQVRGSFEVAQFYEKSHKWAGAVVYYNDVLQLDANSPFAAQARQRIAALKPRLQVRTE
ncbi:MAG: outer membrane protein assembly factor BamD [Verrucomicrobiota bacterium]|jgi:outer membrane protein assembly factor BamD